MISLCGAVWYVMIEKRGWQSVERTVYILLSRSGTCFSRLIHLATEDDYTHASIGLEGPGGHFYSFARKDPRRMLPAGLIRERAGRGFFSLHPKTPCCLYELTVTEESYLLMRERLELMYARRNDYHYSVLGALACFFRLPWVRKRYYFCSQFVAETLAESGAAQLDLAPAITRPVDLQGLGRLRKIHQGVIGDLVGAEAWVA